MTSARVSGFRIRLNLVHLKRNLFLFGRVGIFYQPKSFAGNKIHTTDAPQYDCIGYGGTIQAGFFLNGPILNAELGAGLSRYFVHLNRTEIGFPPPAPYPFKPAPRKVFRSYSLFAVSFGISHDISDLLYVRASISIQGSMGQKNAGEHLRPAIGLGYRF